MQALPDPRSFIKGLAVRTGQFCVPMKPEYEIANFIDSNTTWIRVQNHDSCYFEGPVNWMIFVVQLLTDEAFDFSDQEDPQIVWQLQPGDQVDEIIVAEDEIEGKTGIWLIMSVEREGDKVFFCHSLKIIERN